MKKKKLVHKLSLKKETLRALNAPDLGHAHGGASLGCGSRSICSECETIISCECPTTTANC